jgi:hypothetical protein
MEEKIRIWNNLTPEQRDYDRFVAKKIPVGASWTPETEGGRQMYEDLLEDLEARGCSCHIKPPCSYCTDLSITHEVEEENE